jgi:hypothetical protein
MNQRNLNVGDMFAPRALRSEAEANDQLARRADHTSMTRDQLWRAAWLRVNFGNGSETEQPIEWR